MLFMLAAQVTPPPQRSEGTAAAPSPLFANPAVLEALGDLDPKPGAWAEYLVRSKKGEAVRVRISVLPDHAPQGGYWLELDTTAQNLERMELYMSGQAPIEIPIDQLKNALPDPGKSAAPKIVRRGEEQVTVRAGTFTARIVDVGGARVWRSAKVPLWGLVKGRSPRETIELLGSGFTGAHSVFPKAEAQQK